MSTLRPPSARAGSSTEWADSCDARSPPRGLLRRYGTAGMCVVVALFVRLALQPVLAAETPFLVFLSAVTMAAWYGGVGPGILATVAGLLLADYFFVPPLRALGPLDRRQMVLFALFIVEGTLISLLAGRLRKALQGVKERENRLHAILDSAVDAIVTINQDGTIASVNPAVERTFGYTAGELIGRNVKALMPAPYRDEHDDYLARYRRTGEKHIIGIVREVQGRRKDGTTFPIDLAVNEFEDRGQRMFSGVLRDLSVPKDLERKVLEAATLEQQRIGRELHDTTGQELTALQLLAESLVAALDGQSAAQARIAAKMAEGLRRVLGQVRAISHGLIRVEVDTEGLMAALAELAAQASELHGVTCTFNCKHAVHLADNQTATQLYLIAREAVANALKHAQGHKIGISLQADDRSITLQVQDDGIGLREPPAGPGGMGLMIMGYRARLIGARLSIGPARHAGAVVTCMCNKDAHHGTEQDQA